jgi:hypothetical protein
LVLGARQLGKRFGGPGRKPALETEETDSDRSIGALIDFDAVAAHPADAAIANTAHRRMTRAPPDTFCSATVVPLLERACSKQARNPRMVT